MRLRLLSANIEFLLGVQQTSVCWQLHIDKLEVCRTKVGGTERTRTVIVFVDSEVHTPFCHGSDRRISNPKFEI